ncbi:MAG: tetratricopeptide repeat protein [Planctomycetota bacterium]
MATSLVRFATLRQSQRDHAGAEPLFARALAVRQRLFLGDHVDVARSLFQLAFSHHALGRKAESLAGFGAAIAMERRLEPEGSPRLARVLWNVGRARHDDGETAAALPLFEEAESMAARLLSPEHEHLAQYRSSLASCRASLGR